MYLLDKSVKYKKYLKLNISDSYNLSKKNGTIYFYDDKLLNSFMRKKVDKQFKKILKMILDIEDDTDPGSYLIVLNEIDKFRKELINKYKKYLLKEQVNKLSKKIQLIEKEMKNKIIALNMINAPFYFNQEYDMEEEKSRSR